MVRLKQILSDVEVQAFANTKITPLTDAEWAEVDSLLPTIKDGLGKYKGSDVILGSIPRGKDMSKYYSGNKNGKAYAFWKLVIFVPSPVPGEKDRYTTFTVNDEAAHNEYTAHLGCRVAVLGKLVEEPPTEKYNKTSWKIEYVRDWEILFKDGQPEAAPGDQFEQLLNSPPEDQPPQ